MSNFLAPKIGCSLSSAMISRLFAGFCSLCFLMWAQIFLVTSLRGNGSDPTTLARCSDGCIGFMNALLLFALPAALAIYFSPVKTSCFKEVPVAIVFEPWGVYAAYSIKSL